MKTTDREKQNKDPENRNTSWKKKEAIQNWMSNWDQKIKKRDRNFHGHFSWNGWDDKHAHMPPIANRRRGLFFLRFFGAFTLIIILVLAGLGAFTYLLSRLINTGGRITVMMWVFGCSFSIALPLLAAFVARAIFHGVATPIADIMTATEEVSQGNFEVQVPFPRRGSEDFNRLVESFNNMIVELGELDMHRRNLTADVAHELRTPLSIIQGKLEGFLDGVYQPTSEQLNALLDETRLLTRLVQDLQTLSLADTGQLPLKFDEIDLIELLYDVQTSFSGQMEAAGIDLQVVVPDQKKSMDPSAPHKVSSIIIQADPSRLDQVISNLVANALRYTPEGGKVTLSAQAKSQDVIIQVADTGKGIPEEDIKNIFDRFWKGDPSRRRIEGTGSGLGLAISRKIIEAHDGQLDVKSKLGVGTTFTIKLPKSQVV